MWAGAGDHEKLPIDDMGYYEDCNEDYPDPVSGFDGNLPVMV